ncbi:Ubiquitin-conjugating enzyme E2 Z [Merluccius polli]|uniref:Ubiquitin-conjugating enzyme E2 Z n=1 Tax=Merluccius polli TaxID=89951 RepID=A0AA47N1W0_MERPO|nr:Ubiquitin-conjugating enzyme E2 Z [Merluccius polli]
MADSTGDETDVGALGLMPSLASSLPVGHATNNGVATTIHSGPGSSYPSGTGVAAAAAVNDAAAPGSFGNLHPGAPLVSVSPMYHATSPLHGVGLGIGGVAGVAGAGLLSHMHATSWDPTLSADWDNEKASQQCILRIKRDIMSIYKEPPPGMFVVPDPQDMTKIHALITGPFDTPYEGGFFLFLFRCPPDYPIHPPRVKLITTGHNTVRFNPNFYRNGKVCLSILGTWTGPAWSPAQSISSVLISIQSLMTENPYHNEPVPACCLRSPTGQKGPIGLLQFDGIPHRRCPPAGSGIAVTAGITLRPQLWSAALTMEAQNMAHSDAMSPASPGTWSKLSPRWELKLSLTGDSARRSQQTLTIRLGLPGLTGILPHHRSQLTTSKNYNECIRHETMRVAVCDMLDGKIPCPEALWGVMEKSFLEYYDFYEGVCKERLHLQGQNMQDPFGEKRGRFDYQGLLARLGATHLRIRQKSPAEDEHNGDSDSNSSSSETDPDSQGSSQP